MMHVPQYSYLKVRDGVVLQDSLARQQRAIAIYDESVFWLSVQHLQRVHLLSQPEKLWSPPDIFQ
eukprot:1160522-Prorocentrum_lima.AAC.1